MTGREVLNPNWPSDDEPVDKELLRQVWRVINTHLAPNIKGVLTLRDADFDESATYMVVPGVTPSMIEVVDPLSRDVTVMLDKDHEDLFGSHLVLVRRKSVAGFNVNLSGYNNDGSGVFPLTQPGHWALAMSRLTNNEYEIIADNTTSNAGGGVSAFINLSDTPASFEGHAGKYVRVTVGEDGLEFAAVPAGAGDMAKATYDPTNKQADAFSMANMVESANAKIMTAAERLMIASLKGLSDVDFIQTVDQNNSFALSTDLKTLATGSAGWNGTYTLTLTGDCPINFTWMFMNNSGFPQIITGAKVNTFNGAAQPAVIPHDAVGLFASEGDTELKLVAILPATPFANFLGGGKWQTITANTTITANSPRYLIIDKDIAADLTLTMPAGSDGLNFVIYNLSPTHTINLVGGLTSSVGAHTCKKYIARSLPTPAWAEVELSIVSVWAERVSTDWSASNYTKTGDTVRGHLEGIDNKIGTLGGGGAGVITVNNIAALQTLVPDGSWVYVLGYHTPGDGGGGLFYTDTSGLMTDGGTVFYCNDDLNASEVTVPNLGYAELFETHDFANTDLAFGTVHMDSDEAGSTLTLSDWDLNGHRMNSGGAISIPHIDHKLGRWQGAPNNKPARFASSNSLTFTIRYRYLTQPRRWVRLMEGGAIDVRWFGAKTDGTDARNSICWALNAAKRLGKQEVRLNGKYRYVGNMEIPNEVYFGWGTIKLMDNMAVPWLKNDYLTTDPYQHPLVVTEGYGHGVHPQDGNTLWGLIQFEQDGNCLQATLDGSSNVIGGNLYALNNPDEYTDPMDLVGIRASYITEPPDPGDQPELVLQKILQDTPVWTGVSYTPHSGRVIPRGQIVVLEDVHIHDFGSNTMANNANVWATGRNLKLGNSARNHLFYSLHGAINGLVLYGFAWGGYGKTEGCNIHGFEVTKLVDGATQHGWIWNNADTLIAYEGVRDHTSDLTGASDDRWGHRAGLNITNFNINLEGLSVEGAGPLFSVVGSDFHIQNGVIYGPSVSNVEQIRFMEEAYMGAPTAADSALYSNWTMRDIRMVQRGVAMRWTHDRTFPADQSGFDNCVIEDFRGFEGVAGQRTHPISIVADTQLRTDPKYGQGPRQFYARNMTLKPASNAIAFVNYAENAHPIDVEFKNCVYPLASNLIFRTDDGTGRAQGFPFPELGTDAEKIALAQSLINVTMESCRFTLGADATWTNVQAFFALTSLRNCRDMDGRCSEVAFEYVATGSEGTEVDVQPKVMWAVKEFDCSGPVPWVSVTQRNSANNADLAAAYNEDKRNPTFRITFASALQAGQRFVIRAAVGSRGLYHITTKANPQGGGGSTTAVQRTFAGALAPDTLLVEYANYTQSGAVNFTKGTGSTSTSQHILPFVSDGSALTWAADFVAANTLTNGGLPATLPIGSHTLTFVYHAALAKFIVSWPDIIVADSIIDATAAGRNLIKAADAPAQRTLLDTPTTAFATSRANHTGAENYGGNTVTGNKVTVAASTSGTLDGTTHTGQAIPVNGNVVIPTEAGFHCLLRMEGAHTITFNGLATTARAAGETVSVFVWSSTVVDLMSSVDGKLALA